MPVRRLLAHLRTTPPMANAKATNGKGKPLDMSTLRMRPNFSRTFVHGHLGTGSRRVESRSRRSDRDGSQFKKNSMRYEPYLSLTARKKFEASPEYVQAAVEDLIDKVCEKPDEAQSEGDFSFVSRPDRRRPSRSERPGASTSLWSRCSFASDRTRSRSKSPASARITPVSSPAMRRRKATNSPQRRIRSTTTRRRMVRRAVEVGGEGAARNQQQQTGISFIIRQQLQPHFIMLIMHSQHD